MKGIYHREYYEENRCTDMEANNSPARTISETCFHSHLSDCLLIPATNTCQWKRLFNLLRMTDLDPKDDVVGDFPPLRLTVGSRNDQRKDVEPAMAALPS